MKGATTRLGRWVERNNRYRRRMKRKRGSYPACKYAGDWSETQERPRGPIEFITDNTPQQSLHQLLVNPANGFWRSGAVVPPKVSAVGYKKPPHVGYPPPFHWPKQGHDDGPVWFYHNRPCRYLGHKKGRCNGVERQIRFANMIAWKHEKAAGYRAYPEWDPLQRTPVTGETLRTLGRFYGPPCA